MSKITKLIYTCFSIVILLLSVIATASAKECNGNCAVLVSSGNSITIRINSLRVGEEYFSVGFRLVANLPGEEGLFFELCPDYGYSEQADDNCSAWDPETQTIHIFSLLIGENCFWVNLLFRFDLGLFQLTDWCHHKLKTFGLAFNAVVGFEYNLDEASQFSNFAMVGSEFNGESDEIGDRAYKDSWKIKKSILLKMKPMVIMDFMLFDFKFREDGSLETIWLRTDHKERLIKYKFWLNICGVKAEDIWGFYVLDESYWAAIQIGMPIREMRQMLNKAIAALKEVFPASKTVGVIAVTREDLKGWNIFGYSVSENDWEEYAFPNFDIIGVYCYWTQYKIFYPGRTLEDFKKEFHEKYMGNANQFLLPGQEVVLVPGTFAFTHSNAPTMEDFLDLVKFYWDIAKTNPRVVAVVPFLGPSYGDLIGLQDLSPEVQEAWRGIGRKIKNNN